MPSIKDRAVSEETAATLEHVELSPFSSAGMPPSSSGFSAVGNPAPIRGVPPAIDMWDFDAGARGSETGNMYGFTYLRQYNQNDHVNQIRQALQATQILQAPKLASSPANQGAPKQVFNVQVTQTASKQQNKIYSLVSVSFLRDAKDPNFAGAAIWVKGYKGNTNPVLVADTQDSPAAFLLEATKETVVVFVQAYSFTAEAPLSGAPSALVTLTGTPGAPPAPTIAQQTVTIQNGATILGQQFQFNYLPTVFNDVYDGYWIYRANAHVQPVPPAGRYKFVKHSPTSTGVYTFQDLTGVNTFFYWVSAVSSSSGLESPLADPTPSGGGGGGHTNTNYSPTANSIPPEANAGFQNPQNAYDGNSATFADGADTSQDVQNGLSPAGCIWSGFPLAGGSPLSVTLKITTKVTASGHLGTATLYYSTNNGTSWNTVYSTGGRSLTTDAITLSNAQDIRQVKVKAIVAARPIDAVIEMDVYEIWIEVVT